MRPDGERRVSEGRATTADGTESSARVADVLLQFLGGSPSLGVSAIARELGLSKAVVHRILRSLVDRGLLEVDPETRAYGLGPAAVALGARALRDAKLRPVALPELRELQRLTGETTTVSARVPEGRVYLDQVVSEKEIRMTVELGRRYPLHAGSTGRAIMAFLPAADQEAILTGELESLTPDTIIDPDRLRSVLRTVRATGIAESGGERQLGAASLAAPIFDLDGQPVGSLSVCGPRSRITDELRARFAPLVAHSADTVSRALGWQGGLPG
ncbi:MAG TPA: IclR family transcriptional regulator [Pseudonocardiaceae bacterium]|nr:IclR family transcriptional regulator [Pseudonocardiaceae bacterium]